MKRMWIGQVIARTHRKTVTRKPEQRGIALPCVYLTKPMLVLRGKRSYAGGPRVLREEKKRCSIGAGAEATNAVPVKQGMPSKATVDGPAAD